MIFTLTQVAEILRRIVRVKLNGECFTIWREDVDLSKHLPFEILMEMKRLDKIPPSTKDVATALRDLIVNPTDRETIIRAHAALEGTGVRLPE